LAEICSATNVLQQCSGKIIASLVFVSRGSGFISATGVCDWLTGLVIVINAFLSNDISRTTNFKRRDKFYFFLHFEF